MAELDLTRSPADLDPADLTGPVPVGKLPVGTTGATVAAGDHGHDYAASSHGHTPAAIGAAASGHTHGTDQVTAAPRPVTYAALASLAPASGVATDVVTCTLTGNPTITPAAGTDGQVIRLRLLAGASARTVTLAAAVKLTTGITVRTLAIPSGCAGVIGLEYISGLSAWALFSAYATS